MVFSIPQQNEIKWIQLSYKWSQFCYVRAMKNGLKVGILGAGLGSRMQSNSRSKPLAKLGAYSLLDLMVSNINKIAPSSIHCALRDELTLASDKVGLPTGVHYLYVNTESSLHTLKELILAMGTDQPVLFTMADTIILPADFQKFAQFCAALPLNTNAVLVTPFVDDEKPLWVQVDSENMVTNFGADPGPYVTSGMYYLSPLAMENALGCVEEGMEKMRNFLGNLVQKKVPIKTFVVSKTIDVDHPSDLEKAAIFLHSD